MRKEPFVILGGGASGLFAANALLDRGKQPLVIEGGRYPAYRICGEFLSYEASPILEKWGIKPFQTLSEAYFIRKGQRKRVVLKKGCGTLSRIELEQKLLERVLALGGRVETEMRIESVEYLEGKGLAIRLSHGEWLLAEKTFWSLGRLPFSTSDVAPQFVGYRAQILGKGPQTLEMELVSNGYIGKAPVAEGVWNLAAIAKKGALDVEKRIEDLIQNASIWKGGLLKGEIPFFGWKRLPSWKGVFFIGEGVLSVPPITGKGVSFALFSACMAVEHLECEKSYLRVFKKQVLPSLIFARGLHSALTRPVLAPLAWHVSSLFL